MLPLRIFRSATARYYADDVLSGLSAYPVEYFDQLAEHGFNAVWLRGTLRDLAPSDIFPELGREIARHQDALATVVERGKSRGVQVLLYLNEPLCLPQDDPFWASHPEARGASGDSMMDGWPRTFALCTSAPMVRQWMRETMAALFRDLPDLGGWFLITASEHHTHCYSHAWVGQETPDCPRCAGWRPDDVVAGVIGDLRNGTRLASRTAHCIAWNWSWTSIMRADEVLDLPGKLPKDVSLLLDWERGGHRRMPNGREIFVDEYSLSYTGPSELFLQTHAQARRHGLSVIAKLQIGATHELATVPNLPVVGTLYDKLSQADELGLAGFLGTWNFGNMFSLNTAVVGAFTRSHVRTTPREFIRELAEGYFPGADAMGVARAVERFAEAFAWFPFSQPLLYFGPMNYALAYPLTLAPLTGEPMRESWWMRERGDDLVPSLGEFSLGEIIDCFGELASRWQQGVEALASALTACNHHHAAEELGVARVIGCCFRSTRNVYTTFRLRRDRPVGAEEAFRAVVADEIANLEAALPLVEADERLGFHAECQDYQYSAELIRAKLALLRG